MPRRNQVAVWICLAPQRSRHIHAIAGSYLLLALLASLTLTQPVAGCADPDNEQ